ncbi:MAG: universal stress protein [Candidatus Latescibacteria bacterium]|nr:universal stress protein [Candidatus Latescibacterota bacterium]
MGSVILSLSDRYDSDTAVSYAIGAAAHDAKPLFVLYALDEQLLEGLSEHLMDHVFMGEKAGDDIRSTVENEYLERATGRIAQIRRNAEQRGVKVDGSISAGRFSKETLRYARMRDGDLIVIPKERCSKIRRWLFGSYEEEIRRGAHCPVQTVE